VSIAASQRKEYQKEERMHEPLADDTSITHGLIHHIREKNSKIKKRYRNVKDNCIKSKPLETRSNQGNTSNIRLLSFHIS
jgi:hypothetical protein